MKTIPLLLSGLALVLPLAGSAAPVSTPDPAKSAAELAYATAANLAAVSAQLTRNRQDVAAMIAERAEAIVANERTALAAQNKVQGELDIYRMTRGGALADSIQALVRRSDNAAGETAAVDATAAALRAEVLASAALPTLATDKLDAAAKQLAELAEQPSQADRAREAFAFLKATRAAVQKLDEEARTAKGKADAAMRASAPPAN